MVTQARSLRLPTVGTFGSSQSSIAAEVQRPILVVDHEPSILRFVRAVLEDSEHDVITSETGAEALEHFKEGVRPRVVLINSELSDMDGLELLARIRSAYVETNVILMAQIQDYRSLVKAIQGGARDILLKPFFADDILEAISSFLAPKMEIPEGEKVALDDNTFFVYGSPAMREIQAQASLVARVDLPVLILGESGTGKEILARYIHRLSPRSGRTFLKVNCAAMPSELLESELFGYEPGAFTGATKTKLGKFELCNNGTILLDEIGEMHPMLQAKLLHVLQDGTYSRLGSRTTQKVNVRVLAATNIDIKDAIAKKTFREDLYYRLNGFTLTLPPLRQRKDEIPILLNHFMNKLSVELGQPPLAYSARFVDACLRHNWTGNLRELENFVKRFLVLRDEELMVAELARQLSPTDAGSPALRSTTAPVQGLKRLVRGLKDEAEVAAISNALNTTEWNRKQAALALGISYKALLYKIRQYGLEPPDRRMVAS